MIAVFGLIAVALILVFGLSLVLGTIAGDAIGAIGSGPRRPPETSYWSIR